MKISDKISVQNIVRQCQLNGIEDIVISPGSRNAPFIISFTNNPFFNCYSIVDERSAGYFALGIAQQKGKPVVLVSTSGSASLNYTSAVAEAHMQGIPLLIITADRQSNGLEIGDGQVINQINVFQNFCENNYTLIEDENDDREENSALIQEVFYELSKLNLVHLNVQLKEPLYQTIEIENEEVTSEVTEFISSELDAKKSQELISRWNSFESKFILVSENQYDELEFLQKLITQDKNVVVLTETTGNESFTEFNSCIDRTIELINKENPAGFLPDLIVTIGHSVISKKIKRLFRTHKPKEHWSFSKVRNENLFELDSFEKRSDVNELVSLGNSIEVNSKTEFKMNWDSIQQKSEQKHNGFLSKTSFSDLKVFEFLTQNLPSCNLQMGNSSVVRYIQLFNQRKDLHYNGNRGVSGIDGCTSTALGAHQVTGNSILISGDVSFLYDSNAFWNNHLPTNFKVIVINNGEGNIFKILPDPKKNDRALPFFTTPHNTSIKKFCDLYELAYFKVDSMESLPENFGRFINHNTQPSVLEIDTTKAENDAILHEYFAHLKLNKN